ncbi:MAG TPA: hypothetical protein VGK33_05720 [Chloroflexota bacterium]
MAMSTTSAGLDLNNLDHTSQDEIDAHLRFNWRNRGPLYEQYATSLMSDYAPEFLKLHWRGAMAFHVHPSGAGPDFSFSIPNSVQKLHSYMMLGWETGILNQFRVLKRYDFTRAQIMEVVMYSRLAAGMRGLGHAYRAIGDLLPDYGDGSGNVKWPAGWAADPDAFRSGLDLSTPDLTDADRAGLTGWYENTLGYVPKSIQFGMKWDPRLLKRPCSGRPGGSPRTGSSAASDRRCTTSPDCAATTPPTTRSTTSSNAGMAQPFVTMASRREFAAPFCSSAASKL